MQIQEAFVSVGTTTIWACKNAKFLELRSDGGNLRLAFANDVGKAQIAHYIVIAQPYTNIHETILRYIGSAPDNLGVTVYAFEVA